MESDSYTDPIIITIMETSIWNPIIKVKFNSYLPGSDIKAILKMVELKEKEH
jgi:hypothetical protein